MIGDLDNMPANNWESLIEKFPIPNSKWTSLLGARLPEDLSDSLFELEDFVPSADLVFRALQKDPQDIKVVILGQDPYPTKKSACGLSFSTADGKCPASLRNIFKEIQKDCGGDLRTNGDLSDWVEQGVLLLNVCLTTESGQARAHSNVGWQVITTEILNVVCASSPYCVFMLWGNDAFNTYEMLKGSIVILPTGSITFGRSNSVGLLYAGHPSPMAYNTQKTSGFKDCKHFKLCNEYLTAHGQTPIKWS